MKKGEVVEKKITELKQKQKSEELNGSENISNKENSDFNKVKNNEKIENKMTLEATEKRRDVNKKQEENKKEDFLYKVSNEDLEPKKEFEQYFGYIYKATNTVNGKVYIGQTTKKKLGRKMGRTYKRC